MHDWKGGCAAGEGGAPITACQPLPPASLGFPPESFQEPHCFVSLTQDLGFCYLGHMLQCQQALLAWHGTLFEALKKLPIAPFGFSAHARLHPYAENQGPCHVTKGGSPADALPIIKGMLP